MELPAVRITNIVVSDNPARGLDPFKLEVTFEVMEELIDDLEWKLIYVGSARDKSYDQELECVLLGPVDVGTFRFQLQADPPDFSKIPEADIVDVTALLLTCSFMEQEFVRVSYFVINEYDAEYLREEPPENVLIDRIQREILADQPRVTSYPIDFHPEINEGGQLPALMFDKNSLNSDYEPLP